MRVLRLGARVNVDGRKGKVFCLRLTDADRAILARACEAESERRRREGRPDDEPWEGWYSWGPVPLGDFIRRAAMREARRLLEPGNTAAIAKRGKSKRKGART